MKLAETSPDKTSSKHSHLDFKEGNDRHVGVNKSSQISLPSVESLAKTVTPKMHSLVVRHF